MSRLPDAPERDPDLDDDFATGPDPRRWVPHYLPHWTTPDRSAARTRIVEGGLALRIEADQPDWRPEDSPLRVSHLQTGTWSGSLGSTRGMHRHRPDGLVVRSPSPERLMFAPRRGRVDVTASASRDQGCMLAIWLVGVERDSPHDSGELCVAEIDAAAIGASTTVRTGLKAHHDPRLVTDMTEVEVPLDVSRPHTWTVLWGAGRTVIGCEGEVVREIDQAPDYPLLLMLDLFDVGPAGGRYPKSAVLHRVRGWAD
ncbi:glycoside hydrolase family 16 protein [Cellulomonas fimi]|uniref:glycoside hydrolase family 16 protein n=1 Tax=Cellulomonas sp. RIT-PI-Y TaxID=3035297 RepID=UPI0021D85CFE